ncbi:MAG: hypothetical protein GEEBNDBF_01711 [bacterium]|nr:hypothetical protein [bacterium]
MASGSHPWQFLRRLLGTAESGLTTTSASSAATADPKAQVRAWIQELREQLPVLDQTVARIREELPGREALVRQTAIRLQAVEQEITASLEAGDRTHAGSLALERERLRGVLEQRHASLDRARESLSRAEDIRSRYLHAMTLQLRELQALLQEPSAPRLATRVATLASEAKAAGAGSLAARLLQDADPQQAGAVTEAGSTAGED